MPKKFLVIQTAFIGDVILATGVLEKLHQHYPSAVLNVVVRKGNDSLLKNHPFVNQVIVWNKREGKYKSLLKVIKQVRKEKYDAVINLQRFASSGFIVWRSKATEKIGFVKNPLSFCFTKKYQHKIGMGKHEIERNHLLIQDLTDEHPAKPKLYPSDADRKKVKPFFSDNYTCVAPASVWFTKQLPKEKWIELINTFSKKTNCYIIGGLSDFPLGEDIIAASHHPNIKNLMGELSLLQTAALMEKSQMNYVNDSAPLHLASAMNAPTTALFCSTLPTFGFGPLADNQTIIETKEKLNCRPCGLHGKKQCPEGHFKCGNLVLPE